MSPQNEYGTRSLGGSYTATQHVGGMIEGGRIESKPSERPIPTILLTDDRKKVVINRFKDPCIYKCPRNIGGTDERMNDDNPNVICTSPYCYDLYAHISRSGNVYFYYYRPRWDKYGLVDKEFARYEIIDLVTTENSMLLNGLDYEMAETYLGSDLFEEDA
jgi:hypothetical protein